MISSCSQKKTNLTLALTRIIHKTYNLIASLAKLEIRSRWCELVDQLIDQTAKSCICVALEIHFQIIFRKPFIDLKTMR